MMDQKATLSTLWIFLTLNFIFCDVFTLMHAADLKQLLTGKVGGMEITESFLLTFAILMEIPMAMILLSRTMKYKTNRILNIIAGILLTMIQGWSLFVGKPTLHYAFFSIIEVSTTIFIAGYAWAWDYKEDLGN
jgi:Family of unknown function (DUF6326)